MLDKNYKSWSASLNYSFHPPVISTFLEGFSRVIGPQAPLLTLHTMLPTNKLFCALPLPPSTTTYRNTLTLENCQPKLLLRPVPLPPSPLIPTLTSVRNDVTFKSGKGEIRKYV